MASRFTIIISGTAESADAVSKIADEAVSKLKELGATVDRAAASSQRHIVERPVPQRPARPQPSPRPAPPARAPGAGQIGKPRTPPVREPEVLTAGDVGVMPAEIAKP